MAGSNSEVPGGLAPGKADGGAEDGPPLTERVIALWQAALSSRNRRGILCGTALVAAVVLAAGAGIVIVATGALLESSARESARDWVDYTIARTIDIDALSEGTPLTPAQLEALRFARKSGHVYRFDVFDGRGRRLLSSEDLPEPVAPSAKGWGTGNGVSSFIGKKFLEAAGSSGASHKQEAHKGRDDTSLQQHNAKFAEAVLSGETVSEIGTGSEPNEPVYFAEAYVPLMADAGVTGVVEVHLDQTQWHNSIERTLSGTLSAFAGLVVLGFGVPGLLAWRMSERKRRAEARLAHLARLDHLAHHDSLTGLDNRASLLRRMDGLLAEADARQLYGVHFIDLDRFKAINDGLGHEAGDEYLRETARRLQSLVRKGDWVARLGGDEFVVVQVGPQGVDDIRTLADRIVTTLARPVQIGHQTVEAGASVGIAIAPRDGTDTTRILKNADTALYRAKSEGRNAFRFYGFEVDAGADRRSRSLAEAREVVSAA